MDTEAILDEFRSVDALQEGHFILSSGLHSPLYLNKALLMMHADRAARVIGALADKVRAQIGTSATAIVSPAVGAITVGYEMGRQMALPAMFVERVEGKFTFRRGFQVEPGQKVLMVEDIVTTGLSSRECIAAIQAEGADVVAAACLVDRSGGKADVGVPLIPLIQLDVPAYPADQLPPELAAIPAVKPGSRGLV